MSTITRSFILNEMRDKSVVFETLKNLNQNYQVNGNHISVQNGVDLILSDAGVLAKFEEPHMGQVPEKNRFIKELQEKYMVCLQEKIERLKKEQAKQLENQALEKIELKEKREHELEIKREIARLEAIKRAEEKAMKEKVEEKVRLLEERGKNLGYTIEVLNQGAKRVVVFTRQM